MKFISKLLKKGSYVFDNIIKALFYLGIIIFAFIMLSVGWDVVSKTIAGKPIEWVLEFSEYSLLFMCFLCTTWVLKNENHVTSDILLARLSEKKQALFNMFTSILSSIVCMIITCVGTVVSLDRLQSGSYQPTPMQFPDFPLYIIIPIGCCLLSIQFLRRFYNNLRLWKK